MTLGLRILLFCGILFYLGFIVSMLKSKKLNLRYSLLWLISAFVLAVLDIFPDILTCISKLIGIQTASNAIFVIVIFFMLLLLVSLTSVVSKQNKQIKTLVQHLALIRKELDEIKTK